MGRRRRHVLRPAVHARGHGADQGAVDRVDDPDAGGRRRQRRTARRHALGDQAVRPVPAPPRPGRARAAGRRRAAARLRGQQAAVRERGRGRPRRADARRAARPGRVPQPARAAVALGPPPGPPGRAAVRRPVRERRLRARRVDDRDVRRQLQLARAGVVPGELPGRGRARPVLPLLRRRPAGRVPDRLGAAHHARPRRRRPARPAGLALPRRARRAAPGVRRGGEDADRPPLARPDPVLRVLRRRQRRRPRRVAPDRLDGPRGRPDPPPPQGRPPTFEVVQRLLTTPAPPSE